MRSGADMFIFIILWRYEPRRSDESSSRSSIMSNNELVPSLLGGSFVFFTNFFAVWPFLVFLYWVNLVFMLSCGPNYTKVD